MIPARFGIRLEQVQTPEQIVFLHQARTAPHVVQNMVYQKDISLEDHQNWFAQLDSGTNRYFIFSRGNPPIGVMHLKEIDWQKGVGEAGIFTARTEDLNSPWLVNAVLSLMEHAFEDLKLTGLKARVRTDRPQILAFNLSLGYQVEREADGCHWLTVEKQAFYAATEKLRLLAARLA